MAHEDQQASNEYGVPITPSFQPPAGDFAEFLQQMGISPEQLGAMQGQDQVEDPFLGPGDMTFGTPGSMFPSTQFGFPPGTTLTHPEPPSDPLEQRPRFGFPQGSEAFPRGPTTRDPRFDRPRFGFPQGVMEHQKPQPDPLPPELVEMRYKARHARIELSNMRPSQLSQVQLQMMHAGLLSESDVTGSVNVSTIGAMEEIMGMANMEGRDWGDMMMEMVGRYRESQERFEDEARSGRQRVAETPIFQFDTYTPPDYDRLALSFESLMRQELNGREPEDWELNAAVDKLNSLYRSQYDQQYNAALEKFEEGVEAAREGFEREEALAEGEGGIPESIVLPPGETEPGVDPEASFIRFFRERYGDELERVDEIQDTLENQNLTLGALLGLDTLADESDVPEL